MGVLTSHSPCRRCRWAPRAICSFSFRQPDGAWGQPVNLDETVNTEHTEFCPMVTPGGRHLFFSRRWGASWEEVTAGDVYWVDASILDRFRPR